MHPLPLEWSAEWEQVINSILLEVWLIVGALGL